MPGERPRRAISPQEFAALSGMAPKTVTELMDQGVIPELERLGRRRFIPQDWADRWVSTPINGGPTATAQPAPV